MDIYNKDDNPSGFPDRMEKTHQQTYSDKYDAIKLSILLKKCKGDRTTTDFSKDTGVSITYLTKLLHGNSPSRPSVKYLKRIAFPEIGNPVDLTSYVELLKAAGYTEHEIKSATESQKNSCKLPLNVKRKSFPISFMIDNLTESGELDYGFDIHNADNSGWFVIESQKSNILCVPAIYEDFEIADKGMKIAHDFMTAALTYRNLDHYFILTNQRNLIDTIKLSIPQIPGIDLYIILTDDYQTISDRKLVCY